MAITQNRTLKFHGYAYGSSNVSLTATINGTQVFSGEVPTTDTTLPNELIVTGSESPILFTIEDSPLFPTDFAGSYPMEISVTGGYGIVIGEVDSNWTKTIRQAFTADNCTINGTTLTIGTITSGSMAGKVIVDGNGITPGTRIVSGSGNIWIVDKEQTVSATSITGTALVAGTATVFENVYSGSNPPNSEGTPDCRSSVFIDGVQQVPPVPKSNATWSWLVPSGSTISCNFNVSLGICAPLTN